MVGLMVILAMVSVLFYQMGDSKIGSDMAMAALGMLCFCAMTVLGLAFSDEIMELNSKYVMRSILFALGLLFVAASIISAWVALNVASKFSLSVEGAGGISAGLFVTGVVMGLVSLALYNNQRWKSVQPEQIRSIVPSGEGASIEGSI